MSNPQIDFVKCLIPEMRDEALDRIGLIVGSEAKSRLSESLSNDYCRFPRNGKDLTVAYGLLTEYLQSHSNRSASPITTVNLIKEYARIAPHAFLPEAFRGKAVLDYGCGVGNPLGVSVLLFAIGAGSVVATDPGDVNALMAQSASREFLIEFLRNPSALNPWGFPAEEAKARVLSLDWAGLLNVDLSVFKADPITYYNGFIGDVECDYLKSFDIVLSTSVLEHVMDFEKDIKTLNSVMRAGGVMIHRIDLTDHRHGMPGYHPLGFMQDGAYYENGKWRGLNGLRYCDMKRIIEGNGFIIEHEDLRNYEFRGEFNVTPQFKHYTREELGVTYAGICARKVS